MMPQALPCDDNTQDISPDFRPRAAQHPCPDITRAPQAQCIQTEPAVPFHPQSTWLSMFLSQQRASASTQLLSKTPSCHSGPSLSSPLHPSPNIWPIFSSVKECACRSPGPMFPCPSIVGGLGFCPLTLHQHRPYKLSP